MAAGPFIAPQKAHLNLFSATGLLAANPANFLAHLVSSAYTPTDATDELWAAASAAELATGGGYTNGGLALSNVTLTQSGAVVKWTCDPIVWTASGAGIAAWRRCVIRYNGTLNGKVNPIVAHCLGDATGIDVPLTTSGNPLTITPHATNGIITSTRS